VLYFASSQTGGSISSTGYESGLEAFRFYLSQLTPHTYAFDGYLKVMLGGAGVADILPNILTLLGFGVVFFLIGLWRFKYKWPAWQALAGQSLPVAGNVKLRRLCLSRRTIRCS
jgi:ABC-type multidrug transport system permease subunit